MLFFSIVYYKYCIIIFLALVFNFSVCIPDILFSPASILGVMIKNIFHTFFYIDEGVPGNLDIFEDMIYLTTHDTNVVHRLNKFGNRPQHMSCISQHAMEVSDILIVQEQKQDRSCKYVLYVHTKP